MADGRIDLHAHTTASDGTLAPASLVELAAREGLAALAVTDHDTTAGIPEARIAAQRLGIELVPGIELSVQANGREAHLLGYLIDPDHAPLQARLAALREGRATRGARIVERLRGLGLAVTLEEVHAEAAGASSLGRPHIARVLVAKGHAQSISDAFDRLLGEGRPAYVPRERLAPDEGIALIHAAGGVAVLAHPSTVPEHHRETILEALVAAGLDGVEIDHPDVPQSMRERLASWAERRGLLTTGGSDFHGDNKPNFHLGAGVNGNVRVTTRTLDAIKQRASSRRQ